MDILSRRDWNIQHIQNMLKKCSTVIKKRNIEQTKQAAELKADVV